MQEQISNAINEDIDILLETLSTFQQLPHRAKFRKYFIAETQKQIDWMLKFKTQYENKTIRPVHTGSHSLTNEANEPMQINGVQTKEANPVQGL